MKDYFRGFVNLVGNMTDPIADMLTRIRNAQSVGKTTVMVPFSQLLWNIAKVLEDKGFIGSIDKRGRKIKRAIECELKYEEGGRPRISGIKRVSTPGRRVYKKASELHPVREGFGITILSTPKGLRSSKDARKERVGGEVLLEIW